MTVSQIYHFLGLINPIKILVLFTFVHGLLRLNKSNANHMLLLSILTICLVTEMVNSLLFLAGLSNGLLSGISIIFHNLLWLVLLQKNSGHQLIVRIGISLFLGCSLLNFLLPAGKSDFCYYSFVIGAFIYTVLFLSENFEQLTSEKVDYFLSNTYLLLFAPVLFFIGLSLMFGFDSPEITSAKIQGFKLYDFVIYFVNIVYYSLINIYIHRENNQIKWTRLP